MTIEKKIKLGNNIYFVRIDVEYKKNNEGFVELKLIDSNNDYYDGGTLSNLIEKTEEQYTYEKAKNYDSQIPFMADVLYIYDRIPILSGIRDIYLTKDNTISSMGYISKDEINRYIKENNIKLNNKTDFKLYDEKSWYI